MLIISPSCSADESLTADDSRLTVAAACRQIAKKYAISEADVKSEIVQALLGGRLHVRNQAGFPSCPDVLDLTVECITFDDLNDYFTSQGYRYRLYRPDFDDLISGGTEAGTGRVSVAEVRIQKILSYLEENGIDVMFIPRGWKTKVKKYLTEELRLCTPAGFDAAWKKGRGRQFRVVNHDEHARRY